MAPDEGKVAETMALTIEPRAASHTASKSGLALKGSTACPIVGRLIWRTLEDALLDVSKRIHERDFPHFMT